MIDDQPRFADSFAHRGANKSHGATPALPSGGSTCLIPESGKAPRARVLVLRNAKRQRNFVRTLFQREFTLRETIDLIVRGQVTHVKKETTTAI